MCWRPLTPPLRGTAVYLVRSFRTNARIRSLTTGTFNRVVKDPNRLPPERRAFSSRRTHYESESGCPRNLLTISFARNPVNLHIPQHLHMISTCAIWSDLGYWRAWKSSIQRATVWPSAWDLQRHRFLGAGLFRPYRSGRQKIEKRTCFGGPCFEGTLQKPTGVSESSPVAGTIENSAFSENLDAGRTREIQTNCDRLPHICSR